MANSFRGGIHPDYSKTRTEDLPIVEIPIPKQVILPMSQHIGAPCVPIVNVGDSVCVGQKVGDSDVYMSSPVHASISGIVRAVKPCWHPNGLKVMSVIIDSDGQDKRHPDYIGKENYHIEDLDTEQIIQHARNAGITGMGGAGFPLHVKLKTALDKKVDQMIINGSECEPYITSDHRAMIEYPGKIVAGIKILMHCLHLHSAIIGIEDNKVQAIKAMQKACLHTDIKICILKTKYPQGGEKQLINAITGRQVPPGKLPMDVGCAVFNVDTCASLYRAVKKGRPLIKRVVTVSGSAVRDAKNLLVRVGTPYRELFDFCGGFIKNPYKIISGGPMMGAAQLSLDIPVMKSTSAVLAFSGGEETFDEEPICIHCGKCVRVCPMNLMPNYINMFAKRNDFAQCEKLNVMDCIECGCCAYECPGKLFLVQTMRMAKAKIMDKNRLKKS